MESHNASESDDSVKKFEENPYNPEKVKPEDVVRLFMANNVPIIPVISNRGVLLGVLTKEDVISEMSDIERVRDQKIDQFIKNLMKKMTFDDLLPVVTDVREFITVNLFGEAQGSWTRAELLSASERGYGKQTTEEIEKQKEEQILEWMIYLILEHIPRALYAINEKGKTIFYNSYFEELFEENMGREMDIAFVEASLNDSEKNEILYRAEGEAYFLNTDMRFYYERIPFRNNDQIVGYLIYCDRALNEPPAFTIPGIDRAGMSLQQILNFVERSVIVESIKKQDHDLGKVAKSLKMSRKSLEKKIEKYTIDVEKK